MLEPNVQMCRSIVLLKNGYFSNDGKRSIQTTNTCGFDSVFSVIAALYADYPDIKHQIDQLAPNNTFLSCITEMFTDDNTPIETKYKRILRNRNVILKSIFSGTEYGNGLCYVDCATNVNYLLPKLLPKELYSYYRSKKCKRCNNKILSNRCFVDIDMDQFEAASVDKLNKCLLDTLISEKPSKCSCNGFNENVETNFSNFIMIDLHLKTTIRLLSIFSIPLELNILGIRFALRGCIEYINMSEGTDVIGHYIGHSKRINSQWEMYDDLKSKVLRSNINSKIKGQIVFYVRIDEASKKKN